MIEFLRPGYLLLLLPLPLYLFVAVRQGRRRQQLREKLFPAPGEKRRKRARDFVETALFALAGTCLILALAEPVRYRREKVGERRGVALAVCIDVSKSMLAEDVSAPARNRIDQARRFTLELLDRLGGEAIGVGAFAAAGLELVPLTRDYGYCRYLVENLDEMAASAPGSSLAAGLECGRDLLQAGRRPDQESAGIIILLSDGEDLGSDPGRAIGLASRLHGAGKLVYTVGIGGEEPVLIPIRTPDGREIIDYYRDRDNNFLTTSRRDRFLAEIAAAGGGRYLGPQSTPSSAADLTRQILKQATTTGLALVVEKRPQSLAPWLLVASFLAFAVTRSSRIKG